VVDTNWRNYGMTQPRGGGPEGALVVFVHMASVWVPFTSESKDAIAGYDEITKEIKLALQECGRKLNTYVRRRQRVAREGQRRHIFERYIGEVVKACRAMTRCDAKKLYADLQKVAKKRTVTADAQFDEDGNPIKAGTDRLQKDENVVVVESNANDAAVIGTEDGAEAANGESSPKGRGEAADGKSPAKAEPVKNGKGLFDDVES